MAHRRAQGDQGPGVARQDQSVRAQAEEAGACHSPLRLVSEGTGAEETRRSVLPYHRPLVRGGVGVWRRARKEKVLSREKDLQSTHSSGCCSAPPRGRGSFLPTPPHQPWHPCSPQEATLHAERKGAERKGESLKQGGLPPPAASTYCGTWGKSLSPLDAPAVLGVLWG